MIFACRFPVPAKNSPKQFAMPNLCRCAIPLAAILLVGLASAEESNLAANLEKVRAVSAKGEGHREATAAAKVLAQANVADLPQILAAMDGAGPVAINWLRGIAESVAQRGGEEIPFADLEAFLVETKHSPRARRLAFELIAAVDPSAQRRLISTLLDDPSTELRRDAVAQSLDTAKLISSKDTAIAAYLRVFQSARDLDQIKATAAKLKDFGEPVDVATHMGYVMNWKIIGPFDNVDDIGWDTAYPPEVKVDFSATHPGQNGEVKWIDFATNHEYGMLDLTKALDKHKGAVAYAAVEFVTDRQRPAEFRLGCINANKIWLNGELLTANHVYHAGDEIDQYTARGTLKYGKNIILVKICQNEQTESWAQKWQFQLRVCDSIGSAILSQSRPARNVTMPPRPLR
jgi:hypothetical protein